METRKPTPEEIAFIRQDIMFNAMSVNTVLNVAYLETKSDEELLRFAHPNYREQYAKQLCIEWKPKKDFLKY